MISDQRHYSAIVAGTGPAGMIAALALANAGLKVVLAGPKVDLEDRRTTTLMMPALEFVEKLLPLDDLLALSAPLKTMRIIDATSRLVRSPTVSFHASDAGQDQFGYNIPNAALNAALDKAIDGNDVITRIVEHISQWQFGADTVTATLTGGDEINAWLAVAADGRNSPARDAAGIECRDFAYPQAALVASFAHTRPHGSISTEFHTEYGPFTQVPLPGNRSSLVWVLPPDTARSHADLSDDDLAAKIEEKMQSMLGAVRLEPGRQVYPLATRIPKRFAAHRIALVGEAAHVFPPIGAQGLNLGVRDAVDLQRCVTGSKGDPGSSSVTARYQACRLPDIIGRAGSVHMLNRSLLSAMLPAQMLRAAGLSALGAFAPLRNFAMREGMQPGSGFRGIFNDLREQIGR